MADKENVEGRTIGIKHTFPIGVANLFSDHMIVQFHGEHFTFSFFEFFHPVLLGGAQEREQVLATVTEVEARCIARITVTEATMRRIKNAIDTNLETFDQISGQTK